MSSYVNCRVCDGLGTKSVTRRGRYGYETNNYPCRACNGSGINDRVYRTYCGSCRTEIIYPRSARAPEYCRDCRERMRAEREAKWRTTSCKKCRTSIKYNVDWSYVPDMCKDCIAREKAKWRTKNCKKCSTTIKYNVDWSNVPDLCKGCIEKEKAKWKTKSCTKCRSVIKYNVDWNKVPDLCKSCIEAEKAKQRVKDCEACGRDVKYSTDWPKPPKFCRECANVLRILRGKEGANKARALEQFHTQPQSIQTGIKKTGNYVTVKSGLNRDLGKICSDIIIRDKSLHGKHYHVVIDIDGNILQNGYRDDHN